MVGNDQFILVKHCQHMKSNSQHLRLHFLWFLLQLHLM